MKALVTYSVLLLAAGCGDDTAEQTQGDTGVEVLLDAFVGTEVEEDSGSAADVPTDLGNGQACGGNNECASGWCSPSASGPLCVSVCVDACPEGYRCVPATDGTTDPVYVCVPSTVVPPPPGPDATSSDASDVGPSDADPSDVDPSDGSPSDGSPSDDVLADAGDDAGALDVDPGEDVGVVSDGDLDDDGIPDDEDNLPCLAIYLVVYNDGVTSGSLSLNGVEVINASAFPTDDPIVVWLNPVTGDNSLSLGGKLTGSPSDSMTLEVLDTDGHLYFATVIVRQGGSPRDYEFTFTIDASCP